MSDSPAGTVPKIPVSSPELAVTYRRWLHQATFGNTFAAGLKKKHGLCAWVRENGTTALSFEFSAQIRAGFGKSRHPFGGSRVYYDRFNSATQHQNPLRVAWVAARLADYDKSLEQDKTDADK